MCPPPFGYLSVLATMQTVTLIARPRCFSIERRLQQQTEDTARIEIRLGNVARCFRVLRVVLFDGSERGCRFRQRAERHNAQSGRKNLSETGVLDDDRTSCRQIAGRPLTEPPDLTFDISVLRYAPLAL